MNQKYKALIKFLISEQVDAVLNAESDPDLNIPFKLEVKTKEIIKKYLHGEARWFSIENLFLELKSHVIDPMDIVTYIYNEFNNIIDSETTNKLGNRDRYKNKAKNIYNDLVLLANKHRRNIGDEK